MDQTTTPSQEGAATDRSDARRGRSLFLVRRVVLVALAICCIGYVVGFLVFARKAEQMSPGLATTDAIVVLTGGSERLNTGMRLLASGRAQVLFVTGVHEDVDVDDLMAVSRNAPVSLVHRIVLGHGALDTAGNATETAAWALQEGVASLQLVTSDYHMPRSLLEFGAALPDVQVWPYPVSSQRVHLDEWWLWPGTTRLLFVEYNKFLMAYCRIAFASLADRMST